eukprot:359241-Chlamydomonas_euryale.AAC.1
MAAGAAMPSEASRMRIHSPPAHKRLTSCSQVAHKRFTSSTQTAHKQLPTCARAAPVVPPGGQAGRARFALFVALAGSRQGGGGGGGELCSLRSPGVTWHAGVPPLSRGGVTVEIGVKQAEDARGRAAPRGRGGRGG